MDLNISAQSGAPNHVTAAVANVTGVTPRFSTAPATPPTSTYVQTFPTPGSRYAHPTASNLTLRAGEIRSNLTRHRSRGGRGVRLRNFAGSLYLVADLAGYFVDPDAPDYGSPPPTPTPYGVTCAASMSNPYPAHYTTTYLNLGTVAEPWCRRRRTFLIRTFRTSLIAVADSGGHASIGFFWGGPPLM